MDSGEEGLGNVSCPGCGAVGTMLSSTYWFMDGALVERWTCSRCEGEIYGRMPKETVWVSDNGLWAVTEDRPQSGQVFSLRAGGRKDQMTISVLEDGRMDITDGKDVPYYVRDVAMDIARQRAGDAFPGE